MHFIMDSSRLNSPISAVQVCDCIWSYITSVCQMLSYCGNMREGICFHAVLSVILAVFNTAALLRCRC